MRNLESLWRKFLFVSLCITAFSALAVSSMDKAENKRMASLKAMCDRYPLADVCYDHPFVPAKPVVIHKQMTEREKALVIADLWNIEVH